MADEKLTKNLDKISYGVAGTQRLDDADAVGVLGAVGPGDEDALVGAASAVGPADARADR